MKQKRLHFIQKVLLFTLEGLLTPYDWPVWHHVTIHQTAICGGQSHRRARCPSVRQLSCWYPLPWPPVPAWGCVTAILVLIVQGSFFMHSTVPQGTLAVGGRYYHTIYCPFHITLHFHVGNSRHYCKRILKRDKLCLQKTWLTMTHPAVLHWEVKKNFI